MHCAMHIFSADGLNRIGYTERQFGLKLPVNQADFRTGGTARPRQSHAHFPAGNICDAPDRVNGFKCRACGNQDFLVL